MCEEGPETNMLVVGVPARVNVRVSVWLCAVLRVGGLNVHVSQLGSVEELVSTSKQEKVTGPEKPFWLSVMVTAAVKAVGDRLTALDEREPVGKAVVAKSISATALPLAWFTHAISGTEFASTPS